MSVHLVRVALSADGPAADLAAAVDVDLYRGQHNLGTPLVVVAAYRVEQVWRPFTWKWWSADDNLVMLQVPTGTNMSPHEILLVD
jgi:hypothetical protein